MGRLILLLTTTGRHSGQPRTTPLQYELDNEIYYLGSARGIEADWVRNLQADPRAVIQVGNQTFNVSAEIKTDTESVADFLELRFKRHPLMIRAMLITHGLPSWAGRKQLEKLADNLAVIILRPIKNP